MRKGAHRKYSTVDFRTVYQVFPIFTPRTEHQTQGLAHASLLGEQSAISETSRPCSSFLRVVCGEKYEDGRRGGGEALQPTLVLNY